MAAENDVPLYTLFLMIPTILTILICSLIRQLKKKKENFQVAGMPNMFSQEMTNLVTIMVIFDMSFFIRLIADILLIVEVIIMMSEGAAK